MGTAMTNHDQKYPQRLKVKKMKNRGDSDFRCKDGVVAMVWNDRKPINFLSTCHDPQKVGSAERRNKDGTMIQIRMPQLVSDYNHYMGGDRQKRSTGTPSQDSPSSSLAKTAVHQICHVGHLQWICLVSDN
jgi:hypothetical protein